MIPDISHHHPVKNWKRLCKDSSFLISKATEGTSYIDPTLKTFVNQCEANRCYYWLYSFVRKGNEIAQAKFLHEVCKELIGKYFVGYILDVEDNSDAKDVITALKYLDSLGYKTMFYCMWSQKGKYQSVIDSMPKNCAFWEARYGRNNGRYNADYTCHDGVDLHQYTSAGKVDTLTGNIDLNRVTGAGKSLKWFITPLSDKPEKTVKKEKKYYNAIKSYKGDSIVEALNKRGVDSSFEFRKKIAKVNGILNYTGTAKQNLYLLNLMRQGKLIKP